MCAQCDHLEKLDAGEYDCLILAAAGLGRLGFSDRIHQLIPGDISLHAVGQGALGIECVEDKPDVIEAVKTLNTRQPPSAAWRNGPFCANSKVAARSPSALTRRSKPTNWC